MIHHNIRQEVKVTLEGDPLHCLGNFLLVQHFARKSHPKVEVWDQFRRTKFLDYTEYPGLPDFVCTTRENGKAEIHVVELETTLTKKNYDKKLLQFRRLGVDTVDIIDLEKCKDQTSWVSLEAYILSQLSFVVRRVGNGA